MENLSPLIAGLLSALAIVAAFTDIRWRIIPNWLVLAGVVSGLVANTVLYGRSGFVSSMLGIGAAFAVYLPMYLLRGMGGGDVKLMAAVGAMVGPQIWFIIFIIAAIAGGVVALIVLVGGGILGRALRNIGYMLGNVVRLRAPWHGREQLTIDSPAAVTLPHGVPIAAAVLLVVVALST